jgi:uncharacterized protein YggE
MKGRRWPIWLLVVVAWLLAAVAFPVWAQEPQGVKVRGEGIVAARPDIATVTVVVSTLQPTSPEAFSRASELSEALVQIAHENGVAANDIRTASITLNPEYQSRDNERVLVGWRATRTFAIRSRDFARVGPLLEQAVNALGSEGTIQGIAYSIEDTDRLISLARAEAFANARAAAEELARLAGMQLGEVTSIEETPSTAPSPVRPDGPSPAATAVPRTPVPQPGQASAVVEPGEQTVRVSLVIVFTLVRPVVVE